MNQESQLINEKSQYMYYYDCGINESWDTILFRLCYQWMNQESQLMNQESLYYHGCDIDESKDLMIMIGALINQESQCDRGHGTHESKDLFVMTGG